MSPSIILCALSLWSPFFHKPSMDKLVVVKITTPEKPELKILPLSDLKAVFALTYDSYLLKGYAQPNKSGLFIHYPVFDHLDETTILTISMNREVIATVSYTVDGPSGLTMDDDFKAIIDSERATNRKVSGVWRLIVRQDFNGDQRIIVTMLREVIRDLLEHGMDTLFIVVHPDHVRIYRRLIGMKVVGEKDMNHPLMAGVPEVLMMGRKEDLPDRWVSAEEQELRKAARRNSLLSLHWLWRAS